MSRGQGLTRKTETAFPWTAAVLIALAVLWWLGSVLLIVLAAVLVALGLDGFAERAEAAGVRRPVAFALLGITLLVLVGVTGWLLAPEVSHQTDQLVRDLPQAWHNVLDRLRRYEWGRALAHPPEPKDSLAVVSNATGIVTGWLSGLAEAGVAIVIGIYLAVDPERYRNGLQRLVPAAHRRRAARAERRVAEAMQRWILSRLFAMTVVAVSTALGLWLVGLQLALTLGLLSGLLTFIPYLGAVLSAAPALLLAMTLGQSQVLAVLLLYVIVHVVEGYFLTPLIEQEAVRLPPALSVAAQITLGTLGGVWGLLLASPIAATLLVVVDTLDMIDDAPDDRVPAAKR